jgi:drug/metabolite transporter (DMT)-like permease
VLETTDDKFSWALFQRKEIQYRLWALVLTAIEAVLLKRVITTSDVTTAFFSWCFWGTFFSVGLLPLYKVRLASTISRLIKRDGLYFLCLVFCLGVMQLTTNYVFDHMPVGYALALFQLSIIVSVLLGYRIFKEQNIAKKLLGSVIMILGSVLIILLK